MLKTYPKIDEPQNTDLTRIQKPSKGWHPVDIKATLEKRGIRLSDIARSGGYTRNAASDTIKGRWWPAVERLVANALDTEPWILFPERYNDYGQPVQMGNPNMVKLSHAGRPRNVDLQKQMST